MCGKIIIKMEKKDNFKIFYALSFAWQLGFIIAIPIGLFIFLGFLADKFFGTSPLFLIIGTVSGVGITIYESYQLLIPLIEKNKK